MFFMPTGGPGIGLFTTSLDGILVTNRSGEATAIGELLFVDMTGADAASTGITPGATTYPMANVIDVPAGATDVDMADGSAGVIGLFCTAKEVAADDAQLRVDIYGLTDALCAGNATPTAVSPGSQAVAVAAAASYLDFDPTVDGPIVATWQNAAGASTIGATPILKRVWLNGYAGLFGRVRLTDPSP